MNPLYTSKYGVYKEACGLENVVMSFGHDEFLYNVVKRNAFSTFPQKAMNLIRYHSFYAWHTHGEYRWMMNEGDFETLENVQAFNKYDLYSKRDDAPREDDPELISYYKVKIL
jgi:inositol oxygenase